MSTMDSYESWSSASVADLQRQLYEHLQHCRQQESTESVLNRFQQLFIQGKGYSDPAPWEALVELINLSQAEREFKYTLNRCTYTLVNPWYTQPRDHWAIPALVALFDEIPQTSTNCFVTHRIRTLTQGFTETEQFAALRRLAALFEPEATTGDTLEAIANQSVAKQLRHYPFLYDSSLLTKDSDQHQKQHVGELRHQAEAAFGVKLARYWAQGQTVKGRSAASNPTRLSQAELDDALQHYTGKVEGNRSHRDVAKMFQTYSRTVRSFREFKEELLEYLLAPLAGAEPRYRNNVFSRSLRQYLRETLADFDSQIPTEFMIITVCQKLLNFLVVQGRQQPVFRRFRQLVQDVGPSLAMGLLLRVVLFCANVKPWLENRMAVLFNHHEQYRCKDATWLITALEHVNLALVTNFGKVGYSF
ncbi:MAG: hypothetical protein ACFB0C_17220 [Leptolyngbyaceae cyanobacterium]